jgi:uncharacterized protein (UPF0147 family)
MTADQVQAQLQHIQQVIDMPCWNRIDFWIGLAALFFSFLAFIEAKQAKRAAKAAGTIVKMQTVVSDLTEISTRLDRLDPDIEFTQARDFINEVSRRIRRLVSPFTHDADLAGPITILRESLTRVIASLNDVLQEPGAPLAPRATYYGVQSSLMTVNGQIADLLGLLESKSAHIPEHNKRRWWQRRRSPKPQRFQTDEDTRTE